MSKVLVTEEIAESGLDELRNAGHVVDIRTGLGEQELLAAVADADALIIRSATKVTPEVLAAGTSLKVVGRAGIGLDNVDVAAATNRGVMVVNAPQSNIISAAEHALALLFAQARNVPQANEALKAGRWERSKWEGVELYGKTIGIVGLGRIGALVAQRISGFGMNVLAFDPYISAERAKQLGCTLVSLEEIIERSDFISVHLPKTPETMGIIGKDLLARAKPGIRIINAARGGIVDEEALADAIRSGRVAGAGLDVFSTEPCTDSPLFDLPSVIVTPHLGASTTEAQDKAGVTIAEQVQLALAGDFVPFAVNVNAAEASESIKPFLGLGESLGSMFSSLSNGRSDKLDISYRGAIAEHDTRILTLAVLKGFLNATMDEPVSYVNAPQLAEQRGMEVQENKGTTTHKFVSTIVVRNGEHAVGGTLDSNDAEARIVMVDDFEAETRPAQNMIVVRNDDTPGVVGAIGTALADGGINIADMSLCRSADHSTALMIIATDEPVGENLLGQLSGSKGVLSAHTLSR